MHCTRSFLIIRAIAPTSTIRKLSLKATKMSVANATYNAGVGAELNFGDAQLSQKFGPEVINYFSGTYLAPAISTAVP
jgi:hypothetical protein